MWDTKVKKKKNRPRLETSVAFCLRQGGFSNYTPRSSHENDLELRIWEGGCQLDPL